MRNGFIRSTGDRKSLIFKSHRRRTLAGRRRFINRFDIRFKTRDQFFYHKRGFNEEEAEESAGEKGVEMGV